MSLEEKSISVEQIERIACSGGGAKGIVYSGAYKAVKDTGVFENVQELAGASVGSMIAAFMAVGMSPQILRERLLNVNIKDLLGKSVGKLLHSNYPGISFLTKDGLPLENFLRYNIIEAIRSSLDTLELARVKEELDLKNFLFKLRSDNPKITFADLAILNKYFPNHFKKLILTAVKFPGSEMQIFNADLTPDVEIALACRASGSLPVILQPVKIEINGKSQQFVDGGLFDNIPTEYFDNDNKGNFIPNQKPTQTLVFTFGEGVSNKDNQIFKALYGQRWDEVITVTFLQDLLTTSLAQCKQIPDLDEELNSIDKVTHLITYSMKMELQKLKKEEKITSEAEKAIINAINSTTRHLVVKSEKSKIFRHAWMESKSTENKLELWANFIKELMIPKLYNAGFLETLKRDILVEFFGGLRIQYKNTAQKEKGYQKLRTNYPLRTIELHVKEIKTVDFSKATRLARTMDSLGYLDTINYITNHELENPDVFDGEQFYVELVQKFEVILEALLSGSGKDPKKNKLLGEINQLKTQLENREKYISNAEISRQVYQLIRDRIESRIDSIETFALSRSVEFHNKTIKAEELFKEVYEEGFKQSPIFSISKVTGSSIFKNSTLHEALKNEDMFELHAKQRKHEEETRTNKIFKSLSRLANFSPGLKPNTNLIEDTSYKTY